MSLRWDALALGCLAAGCCAPDSAEEITRRYEATWGERDRDFDARSRALDSRLDALEARLLAGHGTLIAAGPVLVEDVTGEPDPYGSLEGAR